jgi:hypothetical protein
MSELRISVDFNNGDPDGFLRLNLTGTLEDLRRGHLVMEEGMPVTGSDGDLTAKIIVVATDKVGTIASDTGRSAQDVKDAIHSAKENLPKSSEQRNPDVEDCRSCGEVYPKVSGGNLGDSIGNIHD